MPKQDAGWLGDFVDSPLGLFMQAMGEKQIHSTPGGKNIRLKQSLGQGDDFIEAAILNDIRRRNRAKIARSNIPVRPAGLRPPPPRWVKAKGIPETGGSAGRDFVPWDQSNFPFSVQPTLAELLSGNRKYVRIKR